MQVNNSRYLEMDLPFLNYNLNLYVSTLTVIYYTQCHPWVSPFQKSMGRS